MEDVLSNVKAKINEERIRLEYMVDLLVVFILIKPQMAIFKSPQVSSQEDTQPSVYFFGGLPLGHKPAGLQPWNNRNNPFASALPTWLF